MIRDPILRTIVTIMIPVIVLYGLYIQFHGDYSPGGGFQAGAIVASAIILHFMLLSPVVICSVFPNSLVELIGIVGIFIYGIMGFVSVILGKEFLNYSALLDSLARSHKLGIFVVELGVGLTVCCSMLMIYFSFSSLDK